MSASRVEVKFRFRLHVVTGISRYYIENFIGTRIVIRVMVTTLTIRLSRTMLVGASSVVTIRVRVFVMTDFKFTIVSTVLVRSAPSLWVPTRHSGSTNISVNLLVVTVVVVRPFYENAST